MGMNSRCWALTDEDQTEVAVDAKSISMRQSRNGSRGGATTKGTLAG